MNSAGGTDVHCFASIRTRNCIGKEGDEELPKVPLRFKQDENGLDERLAIPGINWNGFIRLRNQIFLSFTESLDDAIVKKASTRNLSISRHSIGTSRERYSVQLYAATAKTPSHFAHTRSRLVRQTPPTPNLSKTQCHSAQETLPSDHVANTHSHLGPETPTTPHIASTQFHLRPETPSTPHVASTQCHSVQKTPLTPHGASTPYHSEPETLLAPHLAKTQCHSAQGTPATPHVANTPFHSPQETPPVLAKTQWHTAKETPTTLAKSQCHPAQETPPSPTQCRSGPESPPVIVVDDRPICTDQHLQQMRSFSVQLSKVSISRSSNGSVVQDKSCSFNESEQEEFITPPSGTTIDRPRPDLCATTVIKPPARPRINRTSDETAAERSPIPDATAMQQCTSPSGSPQSPPFADHESPGTGQETESVASTSDAVPSESTLSSRPTFLQTWNQMKSNKHNLRKLDLKLNHTAKSFLPPAGARNSPHRQALERQQRKEDMEARLAKKREEEERRKLQLQSKREQERLDKIRRQEEKRRRVAEKQAALEKQVEEKKEKLAQVQSKVDLKKEMLIQKKAQEKEERNKRQRERMVAAEQRRKKDEEAKRNKLQKLEEARRILGETHRKRLELEEEERQRKKQEKLDQERERQRQKELERKKKEEEAEERAQRAKQEENARMDSLKKTVKDSAECRQMLLQWKQLQEEKKARLVGITKSCERRPSDVDEATEPATSITPPSEASGMTSCNYAEKPGMVTVANGTVTPMSTEKRSSSKYADIASYELTPADKNSLAMADGNYDIANLSSGDSTDDEDCPKKSVPKWAASASVFQLMREQEKNLESKRVNVDGIFPPEQLLCEPDLARIFKEKRRRFFKRSSSAHWVSPMLKKPRLSNDSV